MDSKNKLQQSRKKEIPELIKRYKSLVDKIFTLVEAELPPFTDIQNKEGEIISTAEQQKFFFLDERNKALDNANRILMKINDLEIELYAPELLESEEEDSNKETENKGQKKNWTKKVAEENK